MSKWLKYKEKQKWPDGLRPSILAENRENRRQIWYTDLSPWL